MGSREFQLNYQRLSEPVKVVAASSSRRIIGYFYPGDVPPDQGEQGRMFGDPEPDKEEIGLRVEDELEALLS